MGLGAPTGVDLPSEASGLMPSAEWKLRVLKTPWYAGETVSVAIGQGQVSATPIQMARVAAFIANGGRLVRPHFARQARSSAAAADREAGDDRRGEGRHAPGRGRGDRLARAAPSEVEVCGKTGSAQVVGHARLEKSPSVHEMQPHGWFICFAPADRPTIALAVLVEHGRQRRRGGGAGGAADPGALLRHRARPSDTGRRRRRHSGRGGLKSAGAQRRHRPSAGLQPRLGAARHVAAAVAAGRRDGVLGDAGRQPARAST